MIFFLIKLRPYRTEQLVSFLVCFITFLYFEAHPKSLISPFAIQQMRSFFVSNFLYTFSSVTFRHLYRVKERIISPTQLCKYLAEQGLGEISKRQNLLKAKNEWKL